MAFKHAVNLVIIDGLCLGIDVSGERQKKEIIQMCEEYMMRVDSEVFGVKGYGIEYEKMLYSASESQIGVGPF